jgi:hypothetical protein
VKSIEGLPETITQEQVVAACEALGVDPKYARAVTLGTGYVEVTLHTSLPPKIKPGADACAEHTVYYDLLDTGTDADED